ncbi:RrF2 family transcriptional regulator [Pontimicrobium sp. IMCC45349]|uniref:RrF2 family transcriptional regulator n=1 Tax=Pontimicrobium sp. IMCC45349 TaxID=3391574 RepID=UPI00399FE942
MFSKTSKYAIKAVLFLAVNSSEKKRVMVKEIAEPINVPQAYIAKLLQKLSREGLISSARGPKGGFYLNEFDRKQTIMNIIAAIDDENKFNSCLLSLESCNSEKPCPLHNMASHLRTELIGNLGGKSIQEIANEVKEGRAFLPL